MYLYILQEIDKIGRCAPFSSSATTTGGLLSPTSIVRKPLQHLQTLKLSTLQPIVKLPTTIEHQIKTKKRTPNLPTNSTSINRSINQTTPIPTPNQQNDQPLHPHQQPPNPCLPPLHRPLLPRPQHPQPVLPLPQCPDLLRFQPAAAARRLRFLRHSHGDGLVRQHRGQ